MGVLPSCGGQRGLHPSQVLAALRYYADYPEEFDAWIRANNLEAERAKAAWEREQALLGT